jgi:hypothetical protein
MHRFAARFSFGILCVFMAVSSCKRNNRLGDDEKIFNLDSLLAKQILLTNYAEFSDSQYLSGASSFLIHYRDTLFAVTAKHLLEESMGMDPVIDPQDLDSMLLHWEMFPRIPQVAANDTVRVTAQGLSYPDSPKDILLLKVISKGLGVTALTPQFALPREDEELFMLGCPYSEDCRQNVYPLRYVEYYEDDAILACIMMKTVNTMGFSGAPVINRLGEVVGIVVSGGELEDGTQVAFLTHIKEIENIR